MRASKKGKEVSDITTSNHAIFVDQGRIYLGPPARQAGDSRVRFFTFDSKAQTATLCVGPEEEYQRYLQMHSATLTLLRRFLNAPSLQYNIERAR